MPLRYELEEALGRLFGSGEAAKLVNDLLSPAVSPNPDETPPILKNRRDRVSRTSRARGADALESLTRRSAILLEKKGPEQR